MPLEASCISQHQMTLAKHCLVPGLGDFSCQDCTVLLLAAAGEEAAVRNKRAEVHRDSLPCKCRQAENSLRRGAGHLGSCSSWLAGKGAERGFTWGFGV